MECSLMMELMEGGHREGGILRTVVSQRVFPKEGTSGWWSQDGWSLKEGSWSLKWCSLRRELMEGGRAFLITSLAL